MRPVDRGALASELLIQLPFTSKQICSAVAWRRAPFD
jgi:hypothetical protein